MQDRVVGDAGGSTIKHIYISKLAKTCVPIPSLEEQLAIVRILSGAEERGIREESVLEALRNLKSALTSVLLTGEVRVKPDEDAA